MERDPDYERKLGEEMLAAIARSQQRERELQTVMANALAQGAAQKETAK